MHPQLKYYALCGIASPILYAVAAFIGGLFQPDYSHVTQTVSELVAAGSPNKLILDAIFSTYNILLIPFAFGLHKGINNGKGSLLGPLSLAVVGILGLILTLFFPLDSGGRIVTFTATMHLVIVGILSPLTLLAVLAFRFRFRRDESWTGYDTYSLATFGIILVSGLLTAVLVGSGFVGVLERLTIGAFLVWVEVTAIRLYRLSD